MHLNTLFARARAGDKSAEEDLFRHLTVRFRVFVLYRIGGDLEAEDLVQDAVMTIAQKYKDLTSASNFGAWAYSILENNLRNYFRARKYDKERLSRFAESGQVMAPSHQYPELKAQLINCLRHICRTNIKYARMLNLYYQGYKTPEICGKLGITRNNAYVIFSRAKSMLKRCLEGDSHEGM